MSKHWPIILGNIHKYRFLPAHFDYEEILCDENNLVDNFILRLP